MSIASGVEVTGWVYVYYLPVDCLAARKIIDETLQQTGTYYDSEINTYVRSYEVEYEIITQGGTQYLVTNKEGAELEYTANIDDPTLFSNKFVDALAWRLCADLVQPLKGKVSLQVQAMNLYLQLLRDAEYKNAQQEYKRPSDANSFVGAR